MKLSCLLMLTLGLLLAVSASAQRSDEEIILHGGTLPRKGVRQSIQPDELVTPSTTDPSIQTFDYPHGVYFPEPGRQRNQLLLFIPGTQPHEKKGNAEKPSSIRFLKNAAMAGYHVVYLMYPNDVAAAEACRDKPDPEAFSLFRWALIEGGTNAYITVPRSESIENRTIKLMAYLQREHPAQNWGQFVSNGNVAWEKVAVAGQSQGGGHAAIIATRYMVARVLCFGAPKDYSRVLQAPAKWYESSATPMSHYFAFNNYQDRQGCSPDQQLQNIKALGIDKAGGIADVDKEAPPFHHAHVLFTDWPGTPTDSITAHTSMIGAKPLNANGTPLFRPVWRYMLNAPTDGSTPSVSDDSNP